MRVVFRADAGPLRGTGHVMRCLTVAEAVMRQGHEAILVGHVSNVPWLTAHIAAAGIPHVACQRDELSTAMVKRLGGQRLVIDSYWIDSAAINHVDESVPTLAIVDHDSRGIETSWLLDQNLGAEERMPPGHVTSFLAGSRYALVRQAILDQRVVEGWRIPPKPHVVAFMGGTDPLRIMTPIAEEMAHSAPDVRFTFVTTADQVESVSHACASMAEARVIGPTPDLPALLGDADVVVSAAGTSAWDVLTLGKPAVLVGVVDNQSAGLARVVDRGMALGIDATHEPASLVGGLLQRLLESETLRRTMIERAIAEFDGLGAERVATALTR